MKKCLLVTLLGLAISLALPTYAQQKDLADPQTTQKLLAIGKAHMEANKNHDPAAIAAFYTRDAVFLTPDRPIIGRQDIQKWYTDMYAEYQSNRPKNCMAKVDGNAFHLIGTAGNELWATGEYSETAQGKTGEPIPVKSYNFWIYVREGEDWKCRVDAWGLTPETVMLVNKSFAQQPAATPSPTASPSTQ
jgi:ketosteroid isomerase-like protein